jgi:serine/threonine protein kinase/tetratricopeptide (TPR) repeat protein
MAADTSNLDTIFCAAIEIASADDRAGYIARACGADGDLRARVEKLVAAHFRAGTFLESSVPTPQGSAALVSVSTDDSTPTPPTPPADGSGTVIGPYKLLQRIGEGGMGTVWMAEQVQPVQRRVALKVVKPGLDSRQVIARFEAERQALALMDHPNIAKVLDAGTAGSGQPAAGSSLLPTARCPLPAAGRPYFVMELVKGVPITKYCDDRRLSPRQRLDLFVPVCEAVQHAHQKGVIHRDLKPSNVLVAPYDGRPVPKVIDFGVAKATGPKLTDRTLFTEFGAVVGTLEYMSPEQAELNNQDIDTRSDIYSLGVLLYELLTGTTPLEKKRVKERTLLEVLRLIREEEPPRPSTRLSTTAALPAVAASRGLEPKQLRGVVRGELDWIVMKCLEKDRNRRYETANSLALDLRRYLRDEPVQACPPSAAYRLRKLLRRHRGAALALAAILVLLTAGIIGTGIGLFRALDSETKAVAALRRADDQARIAKAVNEFMLNDLLRQADTNVQADGGFAADPNLTVREALHRAAAKIGDRFRDDPLVEAAIRKAIGETFYGIGDAALGVPHLERSLTLRATHLGPDHPETLEAMSSLADAHLAVNQFDRAIDLYETTLARRTETLGADHPNTLSSMNNLAFALQYIGRLDRVLAIFGEVLEKRRATLGPGHPDTLTSMNNLAWAYQEAGQLDRALPLYEETLTRRKQTLSPDHPDTLTSMDNLAWGYRASGRFDEAIALFKQSLAKRQEKQGPSHPYTLATLSFLGVTYCTAGQPEEALPLLEQALARQAQKFGPDHLDTLQTMAYLTIAYRQSGRLDRAREIGQLTLAKQKTKLGPDHLQTLSSMDTLAMVHWNLNQLDRSLALAEECLKLRRARLGADHPHTLLTLMNLGVAYGDAGRPDKGVRCLEEALAAARKASGSLSAELTPILGRLAAAYDGTKQFTKSEPLYREYLAQCRKQFGTAELNTAQALDLYGVSLLRQQRYDEAETHLRECLAIREKKRPDAWDTFHIRANLGEALLGQKQYEGAEKLLVAAYEGMKQREATIPPIRKVCLTRTAERLAQLYDAWGKPGDAARWRKESDTTKPPEKKSEDPPEG